MAFHSVKRLHNHFEEHTHIKSSLSCTIVQESLRPRSGKWTTTFERLDQGIWRWLFESGEVDVDGLVANGIFILRRYLAWMRLDCDAGSKLEAGTNCGHPIHHCMLTVQNHLQIFVVGKVWQFGWRLFWDLARSWSSESPKISSHPHHWSTSTTTLWNRKLESWTSVCPTVLFVMWVKSIISWHAQESFSITCTNPFLANSLSAHSF